MTNERREEVVLAALVVSVAIHVGVMLLARPQVMTHIVPQTVRTDKHAPMRVTKSSVKPEPVRIDAIADLSAAKDAPAVRQMSSAPLQAAPTAEDFRTDVPTAEMPEPVEPEKASAAVFDTRPVGVDKVSSSVIPIMKIETPTASSVKVTMPEFSSGVVAVTRPSVPAVPAIGTDPKSVFLPTKMEKAVDAAEENAPKIEFKPAKEIYEKVDEKIVAEEKKAIRQLVNAESAADMAKFVNVTMTSAQAGEWRYFKVMMLPRTSLPVVPKDVVMLIDGSGSIGKDRLGSRRAAARRILRTATNTGDRFNLVVFRNAFSYAFRSWRECDAESFAAGDQWLMRQTAHGRTDVFSTIRSVLTLPRDPKRPLIALVVTDGDANYGISDTSEILSRFTALNGGLVSVYMYGVKSSANRELIDVLTHGNRGESFIFEGWRWSAGEGMEELSERFRDPVLTDLQVVFSSGTKAEAYPRLLRNLYRGGTLEFVGRVPADTREVSFSLKGLNGNDAFEGFFKLPFSTAPNDASIEKLFNAELAIDRKLGSK